MKTIIITRHAKSSWQQLQQLDFERPLNERGHNDAPMMGQRLLQKNIGIDTIISSTAIRAKQTAEHIAEAIQFNKQQITFFQDLYHAQPDKIDEVISSIDDAKSTAIVVCHNPGITYWANEQIDYIVNDMPTCGMICYTADCMHWHEFKNTKKQFVFLDFPKNEVS
jgi:phosphohistidine phosphatase